MGVRLSYRQGLFTPSEAMACTGLSLTLQRDWRSLGLLPPLNGGHARFTPYDLAMMRVMVRLRKRGMKPAECRALAERAAPSLLYFALSDTDKGLNVEPADERGERYYDQLRRDTENQFIETILGMKFSDLVRILLIPDEGEGDPEFLISIQDLTIEDTMEDAAHISLYAAALKLVAALPRPLYTLVAPPDFK